ncbi:MAG: hypothetical protein KDK54_22565 [Leptospiraceae bacterium]|nr:hypothetical protein [Leptospiraceae bacterium]
MVLGFKKQFVNKIADGSKLHTIREDSKKRWKTGNKIHFATGVRTKNYNQFKEGTCHSVQDIEIIRWSHGKFTIHIDGNTPSRNICDIAINDGFNSIREFLDWFIPESEFDKHGVDRIDWYGRLIHWTELRY